MGINKKYCIKQSALCSIGADSRIRTDDPRITNALRYQLRYTSLLLNFLQPSDYESVALPTAPLQLINIFTFADVSLNTSRDLLITNQLRYLLRHTSLFLLKKGLIITAVIVIIIASCIYGVRFVRYYNNTN